MWRKTLLVLCVVVVLGMTTNARAFAWIGLVSLAELLGREAGSFAPIARVVHDLVDLTSNVKEQTTLLKTAYQGIDDAIHMRWSDAERDIVTGLRRSAPDFERLFRNIHDIEDLRYTDAQARNTLRNMLFDTVYGPGVEYLHQQHENMESTAPTAEVVERQGVLMASQRSLLGGLKQECTQGAGACLVASQRAHIESAKTLTDIQEVLLRSADTQQKMLLSEDQKLLREFYAQRRFTQDFIAHARVLVGPALSDTCRPGHCIEAAYSGAAGRVMNRARTRHAHSALPSLPPQYASVANRG